MSLRRYGQGYLSTSRASKGYRGRTYTRARRFGSVRMQRYRRYGRARGFNRYGVGTIRRIQSYAGSRVPAKDWTQPLGLTTVGITLNTGSLSTTGAPLAGIVQGTAPNARVNRKIRCKYMILSGFVVMSGANSFGTDVFEMFIILDKQCNGAQASSTQVFSNTTAGAGCLNLDNTNRFTVLKHIKMQMGPTSYTGSGVLATFAGTNA